MSAEIVLQPSPDSIALAEKREELAAARSRLAERESELAQLRAQLAVFEARYLRQVGVLYADLDEVEALIAEREAELVDSDGARRRAEEARQRAQETHEAAMGVAMDEPDVELAPNLKSIFRELAKRIHPDFARDDAEQQYFTLLMARANQAYRRGDVVALQRLLDDHREINASIEGETASAEILRLARQIQHAERDMANLDVERHALISSEMAQLHVDFEVAAREHRDLLTELAFKVRQDIATAQKRLNEVEQQLAAKRSAVSLDSGDEAGLAQ